MSVDAAPNAPETRPAERASAAEAAALSPMMAQYHEIRSSYPDCLLFYRMGDFYELFFDDADIAAQALDIALTRRIQQGKLIPMAGVPAQSHENYLARLIRAGHKVAVCEQLEDPQEARRKRGSKAMVAREVVRVVTPGTLTEDTLLEARAANYLAAVAKRGSGWGLAWVDVSTGAVAAQPVGHEALGAALARLDPGELLVPDKLVESEAFARARGQSRAALTVQAASQFDPGAGARRLRELYDVAALDSFGTFSDAETAALGALLGYVELTQRGQLPRLERPQRLAEGAVMAIDQATRRNLELTRTLSGERSGSLLGTVDRTVTGPGARLLAERLAAPLTEPPAIQARQAAVAAFAGDDGLRGAVRDALKGCPDGQRALSRLSLGRGGPRDLAAVRDMLAAGRAIADALAGGTSGLGGAPPAVAEGESALAGLDDLAGRLGEALAPDLPLLARDGGFIAAGYDAGLDEWRDLRDNARRKIAALQQRYARETGISSLKIRHNNVLGYFVEVTPTNADKLPTEASGGEFIHRQSLANAVRFTTVELAELARNIAEAAERSLGREQVLFDDLVRQVLDRGEAVAACARSLAQLDVAAGLGELAAAQGWVRPQVDTGRAFDVRGGRHPVVEAALAKEGASFVANDTDLSPGQRLWLLTGPNMAGKSTVLRQNALIAVLAQAGSFVPARAAALGVVDRLFSRVGAADDLASGRSTFMVEMVETATILNQATDRSLVILDEIGRGTATYDGLALAWAVVEHLHDVNRCRGLFATHYHELVKLRDRLGDLACYTMRVREWQGRIVFLHEVAPGAAESSYGLHVARLAGLPRAVVERAEAVLAHLESGGAEGGDDLADLPLFQAMPPAADSAPARDPQDEAALSELRDLDPDELSPRQALEALYRLKSQLG